MDPYLRKKDWLRGPGRSGRVCHPAQLARASASGVGNTSLREAVNRYGAVALASDSTSERLCRVSPCVQLSSVTGAGFSRACVSVRLESRRRRRAASTRMLFVGPAGRAVFWRAEPPAVSLVVVSCSAVERGRGSRCALSLRLPFRLLLLLRCCSAPRCMAARADGRLADAPLVRWWL